jgi:oligosaccharyl transferase (archaeosortase A-associated)
MSQNRFSPQLVTGIILALFIGVALYLRVALPYNQVFVGDWIKFTGADAYHFMRQVDNVVHNFPHLMSFEPYMYYPHGYSLGSLNFFVYLLSGITWLVGLGSPTQHTVDIVSVYFPAILGALTVIPVYFIGKTLFNRWAGIIAAGLVILLPGEFLGKSSLGFTDRHVLETLLTVVTMLFLILAVKSARQKELSFNHLKQRDWAVVTKPLIYSLLAGIFFGIYLLTWKGAFTFVLIVFAYFIIQSIIDHLREQKTDYLCLIGTITFFIALIMFLPVSPSHSYLASLVIALLASPVLASVSWLMTRKKVRPAYYPLSLLGIGLAGLAIFYVLDPSLLNSILRGFSGGFLSSGVELTIIENQPILFPGGEFSLSLVWANFTTSFFILFVSLGILIYFVIKRGEPDKTLLVVWSLAMLAATLVMRRFAYHLVVNVALLSGYLCWLFLEFGGFKETAPEPVETPEKARRKAAKKTRRKGSLHVTASMIAWPILIFFLVFFPNIGPAVVTASHPVYAPSDAWCESLSWLKDNTPDPFADPNFYYKLYETPFDYPATAYGVVAWWDYGYWIIRIGHRLPNCDPGGHPGIRTRVAHFLTAQDEASAGQIIDELDSKYVIIDHDTANSKFYAVTRYAGSGEEEFYDLYYQAWEGKLEPGHLYYPEYYRSLAVRLYNFDGSKVTPESTMVISYEERISHEGELYKHVIDQKLFSSYEEAEAYVSRQESGNHRIVGTDPFTSPVPLEALEHYRLIHSSESSVTQPDDGPIPAVKIFEYVE